MRSPPELPGFRFDPVLNRYFAIDRSQPAASASAGPAPSLFEISPPLRLKHCCSLIKSVQYRELGRASPPSCRQCSDFRRMTPSLLRTVSMTTQLPGNQAIALSDDVVVAAGSRNSISHIGMAILSDDEPAEIETSVDESVIGAESSSMFTSLTVHHDFVCYSTLGNTEAGSIFIQHITNPDLALHFSIPRKSVWSCSPIPSTDCVAIGCSRGAFVLDTEKRWRRQFGRQNVDIVCVRAESPASLLSGSRSGYLDQIDFRSPSQIVANARLDGSVSWIQPLPGDTRLLVATTSGSVSLIDRRRYCTVLPYIRNVKQGAYAPVRVCIDLDGMRIFTHSSDRRLRCFDIGLGSLLHEVELETASSPLAWSERKQALLIGSENGITVMQPFTKRHAPS